MCQGAQRAFGFLTLRYILVTSRHYVLILLENCNTRRSISSGPCRPAHTRIKENVPRALRHQNILHPSALPESQRATEHIYTERERARAERYRESGAPSRLTLSACLMVMADCCALLLQRRTCYTYGKKNTFNVADLKMDERETLSDPCYYSHDLKNSQEICRNIKGLGSFCKTMDKLLNFASAFQLNHYDN